jgi:hypothetical protein
MGWNPFKKSSWTKLGKDINKTVIQPVVDTGNKVIGVVTNTATDLYKDASKAATDAYNYSVSLANNTAAVTASVANTVAKNTEEAAKQGINVADEGWKQGSKFAVDTYKDGAEAVQKAAEDAYKWLDANACYLGLNAALTTGVVIYFTPKPDPADPGTETSVATSTAWTTAKLAGKLGTTAEKMALACVMAKIINEGFFMIPGVKGQVNKTMSYNVLSNCIYSTIDNAVLWGTPAGVGIAVGSALSPVIATLICEGVAPKGFTKALQ